MVTQEGRTCFIARMHAKLADEGIGRLWLLTEEMAKGKTITNKGGISFNAAHRMMCRWGLPFVLFPVSSKFIFNIFGTISCVQARALPSLHFSNKTLLVEAFQGA